MKTRTIERLVAIVATLLVPALLHGCAVVTGPYVPDRAPTASRSMTSRYDVLRQQSIGGSALHMPRSTARGSYYFLY